jgi:hypothetical protein
MPVQMAIPNAEDRAAPYQISIKEQIHVYVANCTDSKQCKNDLGSVKGRTNQILNHVNVAKGTDSKQGKIMIWGLLRAEPIKY